MRLTCPRCGAQYEIPESVIPTAGREVECSACSHVWHQSGDAALLSTPQPAPKAQPEAPAYDAAARPALNRPLHESVLAILREETARELSARAAESVKPPVDRAAIQVAAPSAPLPGASLPPAEDIEWPVATVILPGEPIAPEEPPEPKVAAPVEPTAEPTPPEKPGLPDAERLAATLMRKPALVDQPAPVVAPEPVRTAAPTPTPPAAAQPRRGYAAGFGLAVLLAFGLLAAYMAVPPAAESAPEWRQQIDRGRIWLHDRAMTLRGAITGE